MFSGTIAGGEADFPFVLCLFVELVSNFVHEVARRVLRISYARDLWFIAHTT